MGGGSWSSQSWNTYSKTNVSGRTTSNIYTASGMKNEYNPKGVMRESCDSNEHPNSTPIIIGLDVTGSMDRILNTVAQKLGILVGEIYKRNPVTDPQVLFGAIGDSICDTAPLQVTQFESDIRIAEQLTALWFERGGGGNGFESYPLLWHFAANHTSIDSKKKHNRKGFLFTMGDDGYPSKLLKRELESVFGDVVEADIPVETILNQVNRDWEVFHFCIAQGGSYIDSQIKDWQGLLGERAILVSDYDKIPELIISILEVMQGKSINDVADSWDGTTSLAVKNTLKGITATAKTLDLVQF